MDLSRFFYKMNTLPNNELKWITRKVNREVVFLETENKILINQISEFEVDSEQLITYPIFRKVWASKYSNDVQYAADRLLAISNQKKVLSKMLTSCNNSVFEKLDTLYLNLELQKLMENPNINTTDEINKLEQLVATNQFGKWEVYKSALYSQNLDKIKMFFINMVDRPVKSFNDAERVLFHSQKNIDITMKILLFLTSMGFARPDVFFHNCEGVGELSEEQKKDMSNMGFDTSL
jgi:hypothetical protein